MERCRPLGPDLYGRWTPDTWGMQVSQTPSEFRAENLRFLVCSGQMHDILNAFSWNEMMIYPETMSLVSVTVL